MITTVITMVSLKERHSETAIVLERPSRTSPVPMVRDPLMTVGAEMTSVVGDETEPVE